MKNILLLLAGLSLGWAISSCKYDNAEELYPAPPCDVDSIMVTYSLTISPIISGNCLLPACHGGTAEVSGIPMEGYDNMKQVVDSERLIGAIRHKSGYSAMPKNTTALAECDILKIEKWVDEGAPNN
jgi:hypothetical protein